MINNNELFLLHLVYMHLRFFCYLNYIRIFKYIGNDYITINFSSHCLNLCQKKLAFNDHNRTHYRDQISHEYFIFEVISKYIISLNSILIMSNSLNLIFEIWISYTL